MKLNIKKYKISRLLLIGFLLMTAGTGYHDRFLGEVPSSEPRIASMELNRSAGNMTGDDYLVAYTFAFIDDAVKNQPPMTMGYSADEAILDELVSKFPEYDFLGLRENINKKLYWLMQRSAKLIPIDYADANGVVYHNQGVNDKALIFQQPSQDHLDKTFFEIFGRKVYDGLNEGGQVDAAREAVQMRLAEEAHQKALQREKDEQRRALQLEGENRQRALDTHYKGLFENYSQNLTSILNSSLNSSLNESDLNNALNLSNEAIESLVSPHRNVMMINRGDIYTRMGRYEDAIESYRSAKTDFTYSNDSADYQNKLRQDFEQDKWGRIADMKIGIANQKISEQIYAKIHDLRDAPDVKQLLSGHVNGKNYSANIENHTYAGNGYQVYINLSAYNDPKNDTAGSLVDIPTYIDMFSALFNDDRISEVHIRTNEAYFDKFGHILEKPLMDITLDNRTAMQIGDWNTFKHYIGTDISKFGLVADVEAVKISTSEAEQAGFIADEYASIQGFNLSTMDINNATIEGAAALVGIPVEEVNASHIRLYNLLKGCPGTHDELIKKYLNYQRRGKTSDFFDFYGVSDNCSILLRYVPGKSRMGEDVPDVPYNVYMGEGRASRITWEEFKNIMETSHEWTYDPEAKEFYHMIFGARRTLEPFQLYVHAVAYGYYDDMSEYINDN